MSRTEATSTYSSGLCPPPPRGPNSSVGIPNSRCIRNASHGYGVAVTLPGRGARRLPTRSRTEPRDGPARDCGRTTAGRRGRHEGRCVRRTDPARRTHRTSRVPRREPGRCLRAEELKVDADSGGQRHMVRVSVVEAIRLDRQHLYGRRFREVAVLVPGIDGAPALRPSVDPSQNPADGDGGR